MIVFDLIASRYLPCKQMDMLLHLTLKGKKYSNECNK